MGEASSNPEGIAPLFLPLAYSYTVCVCKEEPRRVVARLTLENGNNQEIYLGIWTNCILYIFSCLIILGSEARTCVFLFDKSRDESIYTYARVCVYRKQKERDRSMKMKLDSYIYSSFRKKKEESLNKNSKGRNSKILSWRKKIEGSIVMFMQIQGKK